LNILHIGKYFAPSRGGVETYLLDVLRVQAARGHRCLALVHGKERGWHTVEEFHATGNGDSRRGFEVWRAAPLLTAFFTPISPDFRGALRRAFRQLRPDVVHAHLPNPSACWLLTLREARDVPLVLHWHSDVLTDGQGPAMRSLYRLYRPLERRLLTQADAVIATSRSYLETSESLQTCPEKCHVVPLGLDADRLLKHLEPSTGNSPPPDRPFQVLAIGRLTYYKGFGFLLRAIAALDGMELHVVGDGQLHRELQAMARELGVRDRVTFHGDLDDAALAQRLADCDCVCLPSTERTEAFGLVLLEAMAFGKPTVSTRVHGSGMTWVVEDGVTGLKVPPRDATALARALHRLRQDPTQARRLGDAGRERFHRMFDIRPSEGALETIYRQLDRGVV
jgi:rhamnosyl/mannosyltransferase